MGCISGRRSEAVARSDEVDRPAHDDDPHDLPRAEPFGQGLGIEPGEPRPEGRVRVEGHLRLQADEVLYHIEHRALGALQQKLSGERRAVERANGENLACHRSSLST